ncbi:Sulfotransferase family protein [Balamuthia mandrillaris]
MTMMARVRACLLLGDSRRKDSTTIRKKPDTPLKNVVALRGVGLMRAIHFLIPFCLGFAVCWIVSSLQGQRASTAHHEYNFCRVVLWNPVGVDTANKVQCPTTTDENSDHGTDNNRENDQPRIEVLACDHCSDRLSVGKDLANYFDRLRGYPSKPDVLRSLRVFGLGLAKTGTTSLNAALNQLGIRSKHTPISVTKDLLLSTTEDRISPLSVDIVRRWDDSPAATDTPIPFYFEELLLMYPYAKFVLTVRNATEWWRSWKAHMERHEVPQPVARVTRMLHYGAQWPNEYFAVKAFLRHNSLVQAIVPSEQLLVMDVARGDKYGKLCAFLNIADKECPPDSQYPVANTKANPIGKTRSRGEQADGSKTSRKDEMKRGEVAAQ